MRKKILIIGAILVILAGNIQPGNALPQSNTAPDSPFGMHPASTTYDLRKPQSFDSANLMNVGFHRPHVYAFQFLIQKDPQAQKYDFTMPDQLYGNVPDNIQILANITPDIGEDKNHGYMEPGSYMPKYPEAYKAFVRAVVERYDCDGKDDMPGLSNPILYWQVDNEPPKRMKDFAKLQEITYKAIKEACPECQVLIGGATGFPITYKRVFNDFYLPILKELKGKNVDIFDYHWYGTKEQYRECKDTLMMIQKSLADNGFGKLPVWITEMGSYSGKPTSNGPLKLEVFGFQSEQDQAGDVLRKMLHPLSYGVFKVFFAFGMIEGFMEVNDNDYFDNTGFIFDGIGKHDKGRGVKKLAFWTYKLIAEKLSGADLSKVTVINDSDNVTVLKFMVADKPVYVCWYDHWKENAPEKTVTIEEIKSGQWVAMEAVPNRESGKELKDADYPDFFNKVDLEAQNNGLELKISNIPMLIIGK